MGQNRTGRINEEVMRVLSEAVRSLKDPRIHGILSIVQCDVTKDLRYCKVYVSVYGSDEEKKEAIAGLKSAASFLRREIGSRIRLRYVPELIIVPDESIVKGIRISEILNKLPRPEESSDEDNDR